MKKVRLDLDRLQVESFSTSAPKVGRGTVIGHQDSSLCSAYCTNTTCPDVTVNPAYTPCGMDTLYGCTSH